MTEENFQIRSTKELLDLYHALEAELHRRYELGVLTGDYPKIVLEPKDKPRWPASDPPTDAERLGQWMAFNGFHTGQTETTEGLLKELSAQIHAFHP